MVTWPILTPHSASVRNGTDIVVAAAVADDEEEEEFI